MPEFPTPRKRRDDGVGGWCKLGKGGLEEREVKVTVYL